MNRASTWGLLLRDIGTRALYVVEWESRTRMAPRSRGVGTTPRSFSPCVITMGLMVLR